MIVIEPLSPRPKNHAYFFFGLFGFHFLSSSELHWALLYTAFIINVLLQYWAKLCLPIPCITDLNFTSRQIQIKERYL